MKWKRKWKMKWKLSLCVSLSRSFACLVQLSDVQQKLPWGTLPQEISHYRVRTFRTHLSGICGKRTDWHVVTTAPANSIQTTNSLLPFATLPESVWVANINSRQNRLSLSRPKLMHFTPTKTLGNECPATADPSPGITVENAHGENADPNMVLEMYTLYDKNSCGL